MNLCGLDKEKSCVLKKKEYGKDTGVTAQLIKMTKFHK